MQQHPIVALIDKADKAIMAEDFDTLVSLYSDEAILVVRPGHTVQGKAAIRQAFEKIAAYFNNGLQVQQQAMEIIATDDSALVLANTVIFAPNLPKTLRQATYVFTKDTKKGWLCSIDNSYGHEVMPKPYNKH